MPHSGWHVTQLPVGVTPEDIATAFAAALNGTEFEVQLFAKGGDAKHPHAFVCPTGELFLKDASILALEITVLGCPCKLKRRKSKSKAPAWNRDMLLSFPQREHTLDQHFQVAALPDNLKELVKDYLASRFPSSSAEVGRALQWVWEHHATSLRVKELFETVETFVLVAQQISLLSKTRPVRHIYDLACGHGLLGVLLAYRFPCARVVCCDLQKRLSFGEYVGAFRECGDKSGGRVAAGGDPVDPMSNLLFIEDDMTNLEIHDHSFLVCVHACHEANQIAMRLAGEAPGGGAGFAAMPCCIRDGLYKVQRTHRVPDDLRYAVMVGAMAQDCGAHFVTSIDREITNRHLIMFGGYPPIRTDPNAPLPPPCD